MCKSYTVCDARYEYVLRKGDFDHDTLCAPKTFCTVSSSRTMYELRPAVDSTDFRVNGTDAVCAPYSSCPDGTYMSFPGDNTRDVRCTPCPPGTYRDAELFASEDGSNGTVVSCRACPAGTYSNTSGSRACTPCSTCSLTNSGSCALSPAERHCVPAARAACTATADAQCMMCPALTAQGGFELRKGMCAPCKQGYYYNASQPVEGLRCVPCPPGFFCPAPDRFIECPGTVIFRRNQRYVAVPTTSGAASRLEHCNCSAAGGFMASEYSQALFGCVACPDGTFAAPGMARCQACPPGTYASQAKGLVDYRQCPSGDSPRVLFGNTYLEPSAPCSAQGTVSAGATACTACPADRPHTWGGGGAAAAPDCKRCPQGHFFNSLSNKCQQCSPACKGPELYESAPCTEESDRECAPCDYNSCDPVGEYLDADRGCPGVINADRPCAPCANKPENSVYTHPSDAAANSGVACTWQCRWGFFARAGETADRCEPCSRFTADTCRPGFVLTPCSPVWNTDASCSQPCDPEEHGKPPDDETSEWVWTTYSGTAVVRNPNGGLDGKPNVGCMWQCRPGYVLRQVDAGQGVSVDSTAQRLSFCAKQF